MSSLTNGNYAKAAQPRRGNCKNVFSLTLYSRKHRNLCMGWSATQPVNTTKAAATHPVTTKTHECPPSQCGPRDIVAHGPDSQSPTLLDQSDSRHEKQYERCPFPPAQPRTRRASTPTAPPESPMQSRVVIYPQLTFKESNLLLYKTHAPHTVQRDTIATLIL